MKILEYDDVDPLGVLQLNMLALGFALTPEKVAHIRRTDPRPFPCFAVYAVEAEQVIGQVGVFRLPMVSTEGREDVGGVWAVSTHPQFAGKGVASLLLEEAHQRMRDAGIRFSTLGTNRYRVAYKLYQRFGYEEMPVLAVVLARWETAHQPTRLIAHPAGPDGYSLIENVYNDIGGNFLGFAWRYTPFAPLRDKVSWEDLWVLSENKNPVGYAIAHHANNILEIRSIQLHQGINITEAVASIANQVKSSYVMVHISRPIEIANLQQAGYQVAHPTWGAFMLKSLSSKVNTEDARRLFGIGTDRFLVSWLDLT